MKKSTLILAAWLCLATIATADAASAAPGWRQEECRYQFHDGRPNWVPYEVKATIRCAASHFGVSTSTAMYVAGRESHYGQFATNPSSHTCGVFQHMPQYFAGRLANVPATFKPLGQSCYNARSNILAALWMARNGWGPWGL